jgi:hypothetical protein
MTTFSVEELKRQVSAGEYKIGAAEIAGEIVTKFALMRRVERLMSEGEEGGTDRGPQPRRRRRAWSKLSHPLDPRRERLS